MNTMKNTSEGFKSSDPYAGYRKNLQQTLPHDIATSLPLDDGMQFIHNKFLAPGSFRHIRSDVTQLRNKPLTKR